MEDVESVNTSAPVPVPCAPELDLSKLKDALSTEDAIENALAGYGELSPRAADITRHATTAMNDNSRLSPDLELIQLGEDHSQQTIEEAAFDLLVRLFQLSVPRHVQCMIGTPSMDELLRSVAHVGRICNTTAPRASLLQGALGNDHGLLTTTSSFYSEIVVRLTRVYVASATPSPTPSASPPPFTRNHTGVRRAFLRPSASPEPQEDANSEQDAESPTMPNSEMYPHLAPSHSDVNRQAAQDRIDPTMEGQGEVECDENSWTDASANLPEPLDESGETPGTPTPATFEEVESTELPRFGKQLSH